MEALCTTTEEMNLHEICDCEYFCIYLKKIIYRTLSQESEHLMAIKFQERLEKCQRMFLLIGGSYFRRSCSMIICSALLSLAQDIKRNDLAFATFLVKALSIIISKETICFSTDIQNRNSFSNERQPLQILSAFRGYTPFMKVLMHFGLISSIPDESPYLYNEAKNNICFFM